MGYNRNVGVDTRVKVFRIIPDLRILRYGKSASK